MPVGPSAAKGGLGYRPLSSGGGANVADAVSRILGGGGGGGGANPGVTQGVARPGSAEYAAMVAQQHAAAGTAPAAGGGASGSVNTAQTNPDIQYAINQMRARYEGDGSTARQIEVAGGKLREFSEGERRAAAARRTARGVSGTGVDDYDNRRITGDFQSRLAGVASDVALGREREKDSILSSIAGAGRSQADLAGADRDRALAQWNTVEANRRAEDEARLAQSLAVINMLARVA